MPRRVTNLFHLLAGLALLLVSAYSFRELSHRGQSWWRQQSAERPARAVTSVAGGPSTRNDPILSAANMKVYGVLAQHGEAPQAPNSDTQAGDDAVPANPSAPPQAIDRVSLGTVRTPGRFLHRRILVTTYSAFRFEIPSHMRHPQLEGMFLCVAKNGSPDRSAAVEVRLLNEEQFSNFAGNDAGDSTFSEGPAGHGDIDWDLKDTFGVSNKYYLVFRNFSKRSGPAVVDADFAVKVE